MINFLGLAGSGKSTQGQLIAKKLSCTWISMSTLLKAYGDASVQEDILAGRLVNDNTTLSILEQDLKAKEADKKEYVIDGWPRDLGQAEWLANKVKSGQIMMTGIVHLKAHKEVAMERLKHRGRIDDTEDAINQRFNDYKETILPILNYLREQGIPIYDVDADGTIEEVEARVDQALNV